MAGGEEVNLASNGLLLNWMKANKDVEWSYQLIPRNQGQNSIDQGKLNQYLSLRLSTSLVCLLTARTNTEKKTCLPDKSPTSFLWKRELSLLEPFPTGYTYQFGKMKTNPGEILIKIGKKRKLPVPSLMASGYKHKACVIIGTGDENKN